MSHFLYAVSVRLQIGLEANHGFGVPGMTSKELGEKVEVVGLWPCKDWMIGAAGVGPDGEVPEGGLSVDRC